MVVYFNFSFAYCSSEIPLILAASISVGVSVIFPLGRVPPPGTVRLTGALTRLDGFGADRADDGGAKNAGVGVVGCMTGLACPCK